MEMWSRLSERAIVTTASSSTAAELHSKIENNTARVGVIGLGYVGLPLAHALHRGGLPVIGFDVDRKKIEDVGDALKP